MAPRLLDLYCKAGGAGKGYGDAGRRWCLSDFDAFHASPPCQKNSVMTKGLWKDRLDAHPDLIAPTRELLRSTLRHYVIENVPTAPLISPALFCGSMFGLRVRRHRLFETSFMVITPSCNHAAQGRIVGVYGHTGGSSKRDGLSFGGVNEWRDAMQIDWMVVPELAEAIPPAYTRHLGAQLINVLQGKELGARLVTALQIGAETMAYKNFWRARAEAVIIEVIKANRKASILEIRTALHKAYTGERKGDAWKGWEAECAEKIEQLIEYREKKRKKKPAPAPAQPDLFRVSA
jgi:DNA (cytosine-5)-methyltransferase 1